MARMPLIYPPIVRRGQGTRIQIYGPPEISTVTGALVAGRKCHLICSTKGLYSENIFFTWTCHGTNSFTNITTSTSKRTVNGTSVTSCQLEIILKTADHGTVCTCQINHVTFRQPVTTEIKLHVLYGPQDPIIMYKISNSGSYHSGTSSLITVPMDSFLELRCSVDSNPVSSVIWMKENEKYTEMSQITAGLNSSKVKMTNFQSEDEGIYWCLVNNSYGWRKASVKVESEGDTWLWIFIVRSISVAAFILILVTLSYLLTAE
ncbi:sialic acid-binding Ig-like lectin 14 [Scyliorhinus canicula]|uniref:sialic acid-binding Ig-like lectin 14 n=1 Tax=Scyliorhinus canicula TaxID=7830 RepID=UPI0018F435EE|nr:sialic acid-binding Ig-like lectin 14 [Scyliorhinus canicula]